jgi:plasmid stability protein
MAQLLVRNLDDEVKRRLRLRAERHGHSMEEEVREILRRAADEEVSAVEPLGSRIARRFAGLGLTEPLSEPPRQDGRPAEFDA